MNKKNTDLKQAIIDVGRLLWDKDLASGFNGNISARLDEDTILLTGHGTCLGRLNGKDIVTMKLDGTLVDGGEVSTEKLLHTEIYKNFFEVTKVVHTHTTYTNAYFLDNECLNPRIFESRVYLGEIAGVEQLTPAVIEAGPVIEALKKNNIAVLRNHGVVAMGQDLFDCFVLIQALEDAVKVDAISRLYNRRDRVRAVNEKTQRASKKYQLFSPEQIDAIVQLVNTDAQMKELGAKTQMTMDLAIKLDETGAVYKLVFENGQIVRTESNDEAEFVINAPETVWRSVFNREIDPFVATTQKKMNLQGDFAKISKWYAPCSRIFELWTQVGVE